MFLLNTSVAVSSSAYLREHHKERGVVFALDLRKETAAVFERAPVHLDVFVVAPIDAHQVGVDLRREQALLRLY